MSNARASRNLVEQAAIISQGTPLVWARRLVPERKKGADYPSDTTLMQVLKHRQEDLEREQILSVLQLTKGKVRGEQGAANRLGGKTYHP